MYHEGAAGETAAAHLRHAVCPEIPAWRFVYPHLAGGLARRVADAGSKNAAGKPAR